MNKYDVFNLGTLIRHIQEDAVRMEDPKYKKTLSSATVRRRSSDIREMKNSAIERLRQMRRDSIDYFPIGVIVEYRAPMSTKDPIEAKVWAYENNQVIISPKDTEFKMVVEPIYLKIKHLRNYY